MSKQVIIGGLGNLGRHLQRTLLEHGHVISVLDRPNAALVQPVHDSVTVAPFTIGHDDAKSLTEQLKGAETVYSLVTPDVQNGTVGDFIRTNQLGVQHIVDACKEAGVPKLVYASSIAVTNHLKPSINENEEDPLPSLDSYVGYYDLTKRRGEDIVLGANDNNNLKTCALRLGAIMAGPKDYMFRESFRMGEKTGTIHTALGKPIDSIAAKDVATAMYKASQKLDVDEKALSGRALFVSKCRSGAQSGVVPSTDEITKAHAELMGWKVQVTPSAVYEMVKAGHRMKYTIQKMITRDSDSLPGMPFHIFMDIIKHQQTFDNSLAYKILDFTPELTWEQALESIVEEYRNNK